MFFSWQFTADTSRRSNDSRSIQSNEYNNNSISKIPHNVNKYTSYKDNTTHKSTKVTTMPIRNRNKMNKKTNPLSWTSKHQTKAKYGVNPKQIKTRVKNGTYDQLPVPRLPKKTNYIKQKHKERYNKDNYATSAAISELDYSSENASKLLQSISSYLDNILSDRNMMKKLPHTQFGETMTTKCIKLEHNLTGLICKNKLSYYTYTCLLKIFNSLVAQEYDDSLKQITEFIKHCKENKKEKFGLHKKWIMTFESIIKIAKEYNI